MIGNTQWAEIEDPWFVSGFVCRFLGVFCFCGFFFLKGLEGFMLLAKRKMYHKIWTILHIWKKFVLSESEKDMKCKQISAYFYIL